MPALLGDRSLFPELAARAYLNHCAISPPSVPVQQAALRVVDSYASLGVSAYLRWMEQRAALKGLLATVIGAHSRDLALISNTTRGVTDIALCYPWTGGDGLVVFRGEFPANVTPWQRAASLFSLELVMLPLPFHGGDQADLTQLEETLRSGRIRIVAISAVQFQTGRRAPLKQLSELCHRYGAELFVDAIQAVGVVPIDVLASGVDYLTCGSHKWLMGLEGAGFLYAREERARRLRPAVAGWLSHEEAFRFLFEGAGHLRYDRPVRSTLDFVEAGAPNTLGFAALEASVGLIAQLGVPAIFDHVQQYLDRLERGLLARGFTSARPAAGQGLRSGILSVLPPEGVDLLELHRGLSERGISCSTPDGWLRFAPHWPNDPAEVDGAVLPALDDALGPM